MTHEHNPGARICIVCGRVLERYLLQGVTFRYVHAIEGDVDHRPVPVRPDEAPHQVRARCDFCLGEPVSHTLVVDREVTIEALNVVYDTEWAMCADCYELIRVDDWLNLRRRAFAAFEGRHGPLSFEAGTEMRLVYRDLKRHMEFIYEEVGPE